LFATVYLFVCLILCYQRPYTNPLKVAVGFSCKQVVLRVSAQKVGMYCKPTASYELLSEPDWLYQANSQLEVYLLIPFSTRYAVISDLCRFAPQHAVQHAANSDLVVSVVVPVTDSVISLMLQASVCNVICPASAVFP
jgi:hypothetical protein